MAKFCYVYNNKQAKIIDRVTLLTHPQNEEIKMQMADLVNGLFGRLIIPHKFNKPIY